MTNTLKYICSILFLILTTACAGEISSELSESENSLGDATPCEIDSQKSFQVSGPAQGYQNETLTFQSNRESTRWSIRHIDTGKTYSHVGMNWETTFNDLGAYDGVAQAINACDEEESQNFSFEILSTPDVSILVNNNEAFTNSSTVNLKVTANSALQMLISTGRNCANGSWQAFAGEMTKPIHASNSNNEYSAKFRFPGNVESACVSDAITHDSLPPTVSITSSPVNPTTSRNANFRMSATDSLSGVQSYHCELDQSGLTVCNSSKSYTVGIGQHTFKVYVTDKAGNISQTVSYTWTVNAPDSTTTTTTTTSTSTTTSTIPSTTTTTLPNLPPPPPLAGNDYPCDSIVPPAGTFDTKYTAMGDMFRVNPPSYFPYLRDMTWSMAPLKSTYNHKNKLTSIPFIVPNNGQHRLIKIDIIQLQPVSNNLLGSVSATKKGILKLTPCQNDFRKAYSAQAPQPVNERDPYLMASCYSSAFNGRLVGEMVTNIEDHVRSGKTACPIVAGKKYYLNFIVGDQGPTPGSNPTQNFDCTISAGANAGQIGNYCGVNLSVDLIGFPP